MTDVTTADAAPVTAPEVTAPVTTTPVATPVAEVIAPAGAPEKYDFKAPEGTSAFDADVLTAYEEAARGLNLTQEGAQGILAKVAPVLHARQQAALAEYYSDIGGMPNTWAEQTKADKELGGADMAEKLAVAVKARDLGGEAFVKLLNKTGLGDHPEVIRTFYRIGKSLSEDKFVANGGGASSNLTTAQRLYGVK